MNIVNDYWLFDYVEVYDVIIYEMIDDVFDYFLLLI
jgi:hypothetical protein